MILSIGNNSNILLTMQEKNIDYKKFYESLKTVELIDKIRNFK